MGYMLGSSCSPCCCDGPCPDLDADCLQVSFSGFAHATGNCNECDFLDDTKIVMKRTGTGPFSLTPLIADTKGSGATLLATMGENTVDGTYTITGLTLTAAGSGYTQEAFFKYVLTNGLVVCGEEPEVAVTVGAVAPVLMATVSGGSGVSLEVETTQIDSTPGEERWGVYGVSAKNNKGTGYTDGASVTFTDSKAIVGIAAAATINVTRTQPSFGASLYDSTRGVSVSLGFVADEILGKQWWKISSAAVSGFQYGVFVVGDQIPIDIGSAVTLSSAVDEYAVVSEVDGFGAITALTVSDDGRYYVTDGSVDSITVTTQGSYYRPGGIVSVTLVGGGRFTRNLPCVYTGFRCSVCADNYGNQLYARFTAGASSHTLTIFSRDWVDGFPGDTRFVDTTIAEATKTHDGSDFGPGGFVFAPENFAAHPACQTTGTATVKKVSCEAETEQVCDMPEQITFSLSGMGRLFTWAAQNSGSPGQQGCPEDSPAAEQYETFCGLCDGAPDAFLRGVGGAFGVAGYSGALIQQDFTAVLDLDPSDRCFYTYSGFAPSTPTEFAYAGQPGASVSCGGDLSVPVQVQIGTVDAGTTVSISAPTKGAGLSQAYAEVTKISSGAVESIAVIDQGGGYAAEIMIRVEPTITAACKSTSGTDAKLSVQLDETKDFDGKAAWTVSSVTVDDGGTGYAGTELLTFTAADGDTTVYSAYGTIVTGREEPTLSASVTTGTGASLSASLTKGVDYNKLDIWSVSGITVLDGGTGYSDGESVSIAVDDGVEVYAATASTKVGRESPEVSAAVAYSGGTGAALSASVTQSGNVWSVSGVTIESGGSGYSVYDAVEFTADTADTTLYSAYGYVSAADEDGAITAVQISYGGSYYRLTGVIDSVEISYAGEYYKSTGSIVSVLLNSYYGNAGGEYYRPQGTGEVDSDVPVVTIGSLVGLGAIATATVDADLESATFGQITGITVTNGGSGYLMEGRGWIATVNFGGFYHLDIANAFVSPGQCESRANSVTTRTTANPCPNELLSRTYEMFFTLAAPFGYGGFPENWDYCAEPPNWTWRFVTTLIVYGMEGPITCTLSPA